jgi:signal transduction histidine kinase
VTATEPLPTERDRHRMLIEAGLALSAELDLDAVLQRIVDLAVEITGARYGALGVLGDDGRIARFLTAGITQEEREAMGEPPTGHGVLGLLSSEARPLRIEDLAKDPRAAGFPAHHPPMHSFLGVPVKALGRVFGNIYLTEKRGAVAFDEEDEATLTVLATQAGVAIENARLYAEMTHAQQELSRLEVLEERERIAKELHDGVVQALFAVGMSLQGAAALAPDPDLTTRLENAVEDIDRTIRDLRNYIFGLRPGILADRQLDQALQELGREFEDKSGVLTVVRTDERVAAELASVAADVVQLTREALSNVGRHANALTCRVSLARGADGDALLEIDDDGAGFDVSAPSTGMGLGNLRERVEALGGELSIVSIAGEGTTITARLPL